VISGSRVQVAAGYRCVVTLGGACVPLLLNNIIWYRSVRKSDGWEVNRLTTRCTSPLPWFLQFKLMSDCGLQKRISAPLTGPCGSGKVLLLLFAARRNALARGICYCDVAVCGVCVSDTLMCCAQMTESIVMRTSPDCSPAILFFPILNMNPTARG